MLNACTPTIYGVNEEQWRNLSASEQGQTVKLHQKMELLYELGRTGEKKLALEKEKQYTLMMKTKQEWTGSVH